MSVITEDLIRGLAGFRGEKAPVTTVYLDVDGRRYVRPQDYQHHLDQLLRGARSKENGDCWVNRDLNRIEEYVRGGFDRSHTRGLAIFSCAAHDFWQVIPLPVPVQSRVVINHLPAVSQLEAVVEEYEPIGVLLADRQRARMFVFNLGELTDHSELFEALPRDYDDPGRTPRSDTSHHVEALCQQHLRHAADVAWRVYADRGFRHLAVGAPDEIANALEETLHPYLQGRLCGRVALPVTASIDDIRDAAIDLERRIEREKEAELVGRLREAVATGRRGVSGLADVLDALAQRRAERMLVSQGYGEEGWRCDHCGAMAVLGRTCARCGSEMAAIDDVVEEAVEEALNQGCRVEMCAGNADLDVLGRIGALLRY